jgi:hypothetical protein
MAQRISIRVLGATLAPYSTINGSAPTLLNGGISEDWHLDVSQIQRGVDTSSAQRSSYPLALSSVVVKYVNANHFETKTIFISIDANTLDGLANA